MNRLKEIRNKLGLTQQQLADEIGEKWHKIKDIETNKNKLSVNIADKIREKYSISFDWLLTGKGEMYLKDNSSQNIIGNNNITTEEQSMET